MGQILDYAKQLTRWPYEVFNQKAALAARSQGKHLLNCLRERHPEADETAFIDGALAKTELLERTVLVGPSGPVTLQQVAQAEGAPVPNTSQREWFREFWGEFLQTLRLDDESLMPIEPAKSTNQFFPMPPGGGMAWVSAYIAQSAGRGGVYLKFAKAYDRGPEISEILESDRDAIDRGVGVRLRWDRDGERLDLGVPRVTFADLSMPADRQRVIAYLADMTQRMIRVLKSRLEAATQKAP